MTKEEKQKILAQVAYSRYLQFASEPGENRTYWFNSGFAWGAYQLARALGVSEIELQEAEERGERRAYRAQEKKP